MSFPTMTLIATLVTLGLGVRFVFASSAMLALFGLDDPTPARVMSRRIGAIFLGLAVMLFLVRMVSAETAIAVGVASVTGLLALLGLYDLRLGNVSRGVRIAVVVELLLAAGFLSTLSA
jgi:hypothetical protein